MALASSILDRVEKTLDFDRATVGIPGLESTNLLSVLNSAAKEYFASFENSGEPSSILRKEYGYTLVADTNLNGSLASGAVSIVVDSSASFGSSGAVAIWDNDRPDYAEFGGNNLTTTLSSVTGISFAHEDDDVVSLLYPLPSNFDGFRSEKGFEDGVSVDGTPFFFTSGDPYNNYFAIYDNGATKYLHFPSGRTGDVFVRYNAAPTIIDAETDTVDIPAKDEDYAVYYVVRYAALKLERADMFQLADSEVKKYLRSAHIRRNIGKRPMLRPIGKRGLFTRSDVFDA